jgi:hypothetical protein
VIAHIGPLPLEELLASAGGLLAARGWIMVRLRRPRRQ